MDDRRRTISSEEQIGEALMRVSNTLEAQRLTKSLEYQEKLRRRTVFRMTLSIILAITLLMLLIVGGALLYVLWKYMDPVLQRFIPFLEKVLGDFGIMWDSLVESSTYMPALLNQTTQILDELIATMQNMHGLPLKEMLYNVNNLLATTNGLMVSTNGLLNGLASGMGPLMSTANEGLGTMNGLMSKTGGLIDGAGNLMSTTNDMMIGAGQMTQELVAGIDPLMEQIHDGVGTLGDSLHNMGESFAPILDGTSKLINGSADMMDSLSEAIKGIKVDPDTMNELKKGITKSINAMPGFIDLVATGTETSNTYFKDHPGAMEELVDNTIKGVRGFAKFMGRMSGE